MNALKDSPLKGLFFMMPELYLAVIGMLLLIYGVYVQKRGSTFMVVVGIAVFAATLWLLSLNYTHVTSAMHGMFMTSPFISFVKYLLMVAGVMALLLASGWLQERPFEYIVLMIFAVLGMMLMVSAGDLITMYMALEMSSLALYVLASFDRDNAKSSEAGLKYFVLGALASGMMLFGMSLVYGFAGTTGFSGLASVLVGAGDASKGVIVGMVFIMVALCFKVSAVPFHMWTPDVYEGAPTPVTAFFATAPKIAALALFARVLLEPFGGLYDQWQPVMVLVSMASMLGGALAAIMQTNIKRLLAYSSISHAGFMLMGLASHNGAGIQAMLIYLALYIFMSAGAFGCVLLMQRHGQAAEEIKDLSGLGQTQPFMAAALAIFMFSMAGIPPMAGFFGKFYVILAAIEGGLISLAIVGVLASVIGCYYYLKVVKTMYFDAPALHFDAKAHWMLRLGVAIGAFGTLGFFLFPTPLVAAAAAAAQTLLK